MCAALGHATSTQRSVDVNGRRSPNLREARTNQPIKLTVCSKLKISFPIFDDVVQEVFALVEGVIAAKKGEMKSRLSELLSV